MSLQNNIKLLKWFNFFTDLRLYAPIAIIYFAQVTGSYALGMSIFSITMVSSALFEVPTGVLSDFVGRRKTIIFGAAAAVLYSVFYAVGQSFWILVIGAVLEGLSRSFYSGNNDALLHDTLSQEGREDEYDQYVGQLDSMFQIALGISAVVGGIIAVWSFPLVMWLSVLSQLACLLIAFRIIDPEVQTEETGNIYEHIGEAARIFVKNYKLRLLSITSVLSFGFGEASYLFQAAFYNTLWPVWAIGIAKTFSNIGATASFWYSGKIIKKFGAPKLLFVTDLYSRLVNIIAVAFPSVLSPVLMSSTSLTYGVASVSENSLMQKEFTQKQRATMGSLNSFVGSIFFGIIAYLLGAFADVFSPAHALLVLHLVRIPTIGLYLLLFKNRENR
ncbi:MFS transporter [Candidatus Roizmanbacteria bacterium]|nr:MAG: MFS transporter [Candidatus Roizmanbacteria bacterium]